MIYRYPNIKERKKLVSLSLTSITHYFLAFNVLFKFSSFRVYNAKCQNVLIIKNFLVQLLKLFSSYIVIIELYNQNKKTKKKQKVLIVHV